MYSLQQTLDIFNRLDADLQAKSEAENRKVTANRESKNETSSAKTSISSLQLSSTAGEIKNIANGSLDTKALVLQALQSDDDDDDDDDSSGDGDVDVAIQHVGHNKDDDDDDDDSSRDGDGDVAIQHVGHNKDDDNDDSSGDGDVDVDVAIQHVGHNKDDDNDDILPVGDEDDDNDHQHIEAIAIVDNNIITNDGEKSPADFLDHIPEFISEEPEPPADENTTSDTKMYNDNSIHKKDIIDSVVEELLQDNGDLDDEDTAYLPNSADVKTRAENAKDGKASLKPDISEGANIEEGSSTGHTFTRGPALRTEPARKKKCCEEPALRTEPARKKSCEEPLLSCSMCDYTTHSKVQLGIHMSKHQLTCDICKISLVWKDYKSHLTLRHGKYPCHYCRIVLKDKNDAKVHFRRLHKVPLFGCPDCPVLLTKHEHRSGHHKQEHLKNSNNKPVEKGNCHDTKMGPEKVTGAKNCEKTKSECPESKIDSCETTDGTEYASTSKSPQKKQISVQICLYCEKKNGANHNLNCHVRNFYKYSVKRYTQAKWRRFFASKIHNDSKKNKNDQIIEADRDEDGFHGFDEADLLDLKNPHEFLHAPCGLETYQRLKNGAPIFQLGPDFNN